MKAISYFILIVTAVELSSGVLTPFQLRFKISKAHCEPAKGYGRKPTPCYDFRTKELATAEECNARKNSHCCLYKCACIIKGAGTRRGIIPMKYKLPSPPEQKFLEGCGAEPTKTPKLTTTETQMNATNESKTIPSTKPTRPTNWPTSNPVVKKPTSQKPKPKSTSRLPKRKPTRPIKRPSLKPAVRKPIAPKSKPKPTSRLSKRKPTRPTKRPTSKPAVRKPIAPKFNPNPAPRVPKRKPATNRRNQRTSQNAAVRNQSSKVKPPAKPARNPNRRVRKPSGVTKRPTASKPSTISTSRQPAKTPTVANSVRKPVPRAKPSKKPVRTPASTTTTKKPCTTTKAKPSFGFSFFSRLSFVLSGSGFNSNVVNGGPCA